MSPTVITSARHTEGFLDVAWKLESESDLVLGLGNGDSVGEKPELQNEPHRQKGRAMPRPIHLAHLSQLP